MLGPEPAPLAELDDTAPSDVGISLGLCNLCAVLLDVVEHQPFTQREVAERQLFCLDFAQDRVDEYRPRDTQVGAARIEPRHLETLFDVRVHDPIAETVDAPRADASVAQIANDGSLGRQRQSAKAEDGAGGANDAVEAAAGDFRKVLTHLAVDVLDEPALVAARERIALDVSLAQPNDTGLETATGLHRGGCTQGDLNAAASDVDDAGARTAHVHAVRGSQVNEPRLFGAGDDADLDAGATIDFGDEISAVLGFAGGAGGPGDDLVDFVRFRDPLELGEGLKARGHRRIC